MAMTQMGDMQWKTFSPKMPRPENRNTNARTERPQSRISFYGNA